MAALPHSQHCTGSLPWRKFPLLERKKNSLCWSSVQGWWVTSPALPRPLPGCGLSPGLTLFLPLFIFHFLLQLLRALRPLLSFMSKVLALTKPWLLSRSLFPLPGVFSLGSQVSLVCGQQEMLCWWLPSCCLCVTIPLLKPLHA